jgi:peptidoglycan hydrolase-like protein with peptidoglycan-binding domain
MSRSFEQRPASSSSGFVPPQPMTEKRSSFSAFWREEETSDQSNAQPAQRSARSSNILDRLLAAKASAAPGEAAPAKLGNEGQGERQETEGEEKQASDSSAIALRQGGEQPGQGRVKGEGRSNLLAATPGSRGFEAQGQNLVAQRPVQLEYIYEVFTHSSSRDREYWVAIIQKIYGLEKDKASAFYDWYLFYNRRDGIYGPPQQESPVLQEDGRYKWRIFASAINLPLLQEFRNYQTIQQRSPDTIGPLPYETRIANVERAREFRYSEEDVKRIQRLVGATIDGDYGEQTVEQVRKWQIKQGISPADGIVGGVTLDEMKKWGLRVGNPPIREAPRPAPPPAAKTPRPAPSPPPKPVNSGPPVSSLVPPIGTLSPSPPFAGAAPIDVAVYQVSERGGKLQVVIAGMEKELPGRSLVNDSDSPMVLTRNGTRRTFRKGETIDLQPGDRLTVPLYSRVPKPANQSPASNGGSASAPPSSNPNSGSSQTGRVDRPSSSSSSQPSGGKLGSISSGGATNGSPALGIDAVGNSPATTTSRTPGTLIVPGKSPPQKDSGRLPSSNIQLREGKDLGRVGLVFNEEGVNLRDSPKPGNQSKVLQKLAFNTRLFVDKEISGGWYLVTLGNGTYGYVDKTYIKTNLPEPAAQLYKVGSGDTAQTIVQRFYRDIRPGLDERFYVNVLAYANPNAGIIQPPSPGDWAKTGVQKDLLIWIPSTSFAQSLKGIVESGSITGGLWSQAEQTATTVGNVALGGGAFVAGILHGALESIWDLLVSIPQLVGLAWEVVQSLLQGNLLSDVEQLWKMLSNLDTNALVAAGLQALEQRWNDPDLFKRWEFRGWLLGYAATEIAMLFFSEGILTAVKAAGKAGAFAKIVERFPQVARLMESAKQAAASSKAAELQRAIKSSKPVQALLKAREWAGQTLKIPAETLKDLSLDAIKRLQQLPGWARERFSQLSHEAMRRVLGCASPCKVNIQAVEDYLRNLATKAGAGAKQLLTAEDVINALPKDLLNLETIRSKLSNPELLNIIRRAGLTDLDFAKMRDFITKGFVGNKKDAYDLLTQYLGAVVPSKIGPDLNKFIEFANPLKDYTGRALKGSFFENFAKLYMPEFRGLEKATFQTPGTIGKRGQKTADAFDRTNGTIWDFKYQDTKLGKDTVTNYEKILGQAPIDGQGGIAKTVNFVFATEELAQLNQANVKALKAGGVFYVKQVPGQAIQLIRIL